MRCLGSERKVFTLGLPHLYILFSPQHPSRLKLLHNKSSSRRQFKLKGTANALNMKGAASHRPTGFAKARQFARKTPDERSYQDRNRTGALVITTFPIPDKFEHLHIVRSNSSSSGRRYRSAGVVVPGPSSWPMATPCSTVNSAPTRARVYRDCQRAVPPLARWTSSFRRYRTEAAICEAWTAAASHLELAALVGPTRRREGLLSGPSLSIYTGRRCRAGSSFAARAVSCHIVGRRETIEPACLLTLGRAALRS